VEYDTNPALRTLTTVAFMRYMPMPGLVLRRSSETLLCLTRCNTMTATLPAYL